MRNNKVKRNLYFYQWSRSYFDIAENYNRVSCSIRDFEYDNNLEDFCRLKNEGIEVCAYIPVLWKPEDGIEPEELGRFIDAVYVGNAGQIEWAKKIGKRVLGDSGLNVFNFETVKFYKEQGLEGITISYELDGEVETIAAGINIDGLQDLELEILRYGRVPAMISEYCPLAGAEGIKGSGCGKCRGNNPVYLKDNMGELYPVLLNDKGCTSLILSKTPLNRKNSVKELEKYDSIIERITVFDENPTFLERI